MKYFTIAELIYSRDYWKVLWNKTTPEIEQNLTALVAAVLDPLRERYGKPINVNSGFRCKELNRLVKGAVNSQHMSGEAADIDTGSKTENKKLAKLIVQMGLPFDQLIDEANYAWVHVSYKCRGVNRGQILRMRNGKYTSIKPEEL